MAQRVVNSIHRITNITSDKEIDYGLHVLKCDRQYDDGTIDHNTTAIVSPREYTEIQRYGYYTVYEDGELGG